MHTSTNESGYTSPQPNIKRSNPFESPAEAILVSPLIEGTRTFHFRNKQKTLGQTPNKKNVIELNKNQIGSAHLITNPLGTDLFITDETRWKNEAEEKSEKRAKLGSDDNSPFEVRRPPDWKRDPEILLKAQAQCL